MVPSGSGVIAVNGGAGAFDSVIVNGSCPELVMRNVPTPCAPEPSCTPPVSTLTVENVNWPGVLTAPLTFTVTVPVLRRTRNELA